MQLFKWKISRAILFSICLIVGIASLNGCSLLSPVCTEPQKKYVIDSIPCSVPQKQRTQHNLFVTPVDSSPVYNTTGIAYSVCPHQIAYFAKNAWLVTPAQMIHEQIIEMLYRTHHFHSVGSAPAVGYFQYILHPRLIGLRQIFYGDQPSQVHLKMQATIIRAADSAILASKEFSVCVTAPHNSPLGGVIAANCANEIFLRELALFCLKKI